MSSWQKLGAVISILWVIGFLIFLIVHSGSLTIVGNALVADKAFTLWLMILGPVVLLWAVGIIALDAMEWIRRRIYRTEEHAHND